MLGKTWISATKTLKKHNLQQWNLYSSISNSFWDISNSLNLPVSHVVKILWEIHVCARKKCRQKNGFPLKNLKKNLQKWNPYSSNSNSFRDISNSFNFPVSHVFKIIWEMHVCGRKTIWQKNWFLHQKLQKNITSKNGIYIAISRIFFEI